MSKAMSGKRPFKVGFVGGSISTGQGASSEQVTAWIPTFKRYLEKVFPGISVRNGCIAGTPSAYMVVCLEMSVDADADVVFSEYILNDGKMDSIVGNINVQETERLIRRILSLPGRPAFVFMQTFTHGMTYPLGHNEYRPFHEGIEDVYGALAQFYDLPWLSMRDATYLIAVHRNVSGFDYNEIMNSRNGDLIHPSDLGHKMMADLAVWLFQSTMIDVLIRPLDDEDKMMLGEEIPTPMYQGNYVPTNVPMCLQFEALKTIIANSSGFVFIEEGAKKKKGFVAHQPGSSILFHLNTVRDQSGGQVLVQIGHLKSYEGMGMAEARCISGCTCEPKVIDGLQSRRVSQTYLAGISVSQAADCFLRLNVLNKTSSTTGNKFKVTGLMVSDTANPSKTHGFMKEEEFGAMSTT